MGNLGFFFFSSPVHFLFSVGGGKKSVFKKDKPTLGVKRNSLLIDFTASVWALRAAPPHQGGAAGLPTRLTVEYVTNSCRGDGDCGQDGWLRGRLQGVHCDCC